MAFLFWPFMIASLILSILAIRIKKPILLVISSVLIVPLSLYLAATPRFEIWGLLFPLFYVGAAVSLAKRMNWLSILLIAPNFILIGWMGFAVMNQ
ncbi:hypothetical protein V7138_24195 [Bacillus sp. JJ1533]|uniref:hypothetical protein n=1 Tax=Bacillus sp. JJ1533 TaxID=3122959 RepID=UPI002FFD7370